MGINAEYMGDTANFPGPKYGLPGYKESHKWETDVDVFSPLVFDPRFYRALIHMKSASAGVMSESALRVHWDTAVKAKKAPNCPQGNVFFDANEYYKMHKKKPEFNMGGNACSLIVRVYVGQGVFKGYETSQYQAGSKAFPTLATKLFAPVGSKRKSASSAVFQVKAGQYFGTPMPGAGVFDNSFTAARHMTLVFWLQVAPQSEAPNAELFAYGGAQTDNYFRTGFGCIAASVASKKTKCYFITVFQAGTTKEYFHTYNNDNFEILRAAYGGSKWGHTVFMLTTAAPGFRGDGVAGCPTNGVSPQTGAASDACSVPSSSGSTGTASSLWTGTTVPAPSTPPSGRVLSLAAP